MLIMTSPVKVLAPAAEEIVRLPLIPPPTVVVPLTVSAKPEFVNVVPLPMLRLLLMVRASTVVAVAVPLRVKFPPIGLVPVVKVFVLLPERVRLL